MRLISLAFCVRKGLRREIVLSIALFGPGGCVFLSAGKIHYINNQLCVAHCCLPSFPIHPRARFYCAVCVCVFVCALCLYDWVNVIYSWCINWPQIGAQCPPAQGVLPLLLLGGSSVCVPFNPSASATKCERIRRTNERTNEHTRRRRRGVSFGASVQCAILPPLYIYMRTTYTHDICIQRRLR